MTLRQEPEGRPSYPQTEGWAPAAASKLTPGTQISQHSVFLAHIPKEKKKLQKYWMEDFLHKESRRQVVYNASELVYKEKYI